MIKKYYIENGSRHTESRVHSIETNNLRFSFYRNDQDRYIIPISYTGGSRALSDEERILMELFESEMYCLQSATSGSTRSENPEELYSFIINRSRHLFRNRKDLLDLI